VTRARGRGVATIAAAVVAAGARLAPTAHAGATPPTRAAADTAGVDALFAEWATRATPGCVVGATRDGRRLFVRAYGMADLSHGVPNAERTVFEAGSVSKQFTAAAILLLVDDGRLALDDDVRRHVPELPDHGVRMTIDHLLTHTSGLRDWSVVTALAGMPRGEHVVTHADVLDIVARQRQLNHAPGAHFGYTNTGYGLLALIVERVSGRTFADFTRERLFVPLGMTSTGWRDDFRRPVPHRATAYRRAGAAFAEAMPFESTIGHAGLLTTVDDLLRWNEALRTERLGAAVTGALRRKVVLATGRAVRYGRGLWVDTYAGHAELSHGGTTAGYHAWLGRYPAAGLSVALLCNAPVDDVALAHRVVDRLLAPRPHAAVAGPTRDAPAVALAPAQVNAMAGVFVSDVTGLPEIFAVAGATLTNGGEAGRIVSADRVRFGWGDVVYESRDRIAIIETTGERRTYRRVDGPAPSVAAMSALAGRYYSRDAAAIYVVGVENGRLALRVDGRPTFVLRPAPVGPDVYRTATTLLRVHRAADGGVASLTLSADRVRELRMEPLAPAASGAAR
jgi:CubicO group peptidase (beta-lactamase class C family)